MVIRTRARPRAAAAVSMVAVVVLGIAGIGLAGALDHRSPALAPAARVIVTLDDATKEVFDVQGTLDLTYDHSAGSMLVTSVPGGKRLVIETVSVEGGGVTIVEPGNELTDLRTVEHATMFIGCEPPGPSISVPLHALSWGQPWRSWTLSGTQSARAYADAGCGVNIAAAFPASGDTREEMHITVHVMGYLVPRH